MVGIGSAPNSYLMTRAAELGRGTFTHIGEAAEVTARMQDLFSKIGSPVVTELKAELVGNAARITPDMLPDLYRGEPVLLMAEAKDLGGSLKISGNIGAQPWEVTLPISKAAKGDGISKLWARRRIADFEVASTLGTLTSDDANKAILAMALDHQIVSSQTSLVAVDKTPKRPAGEKLTRADIPLNLPAGWDYDSVFGEDTPAVEQRDAQAEFTAIGHVAEAGGDPCPAAGDAAANRDAGGINDAHRRISPGFESCVQAGYPPPDPAADVIWSPQPSLCPKSDRCACRAGPSSIS